jgi:hypothetical protein
VPAEQAQNGILVLLSRGGVAWLHLDYGNEEHFLRMIAFPLNRHDAEVCQQPPLDLSRDLALTSGKRIQAVR